MKLKWIITSLTSGVVILFSCSKLDNYDKPNGTIYGKLIDANTNQPFLTEEPNGFRIRYIEQNYINPKVSVQNFYGKADGSFERAYVPAATYKVIPIEGAFFPLIDTATVSVADNGRSEINFTVVPYLNLTASAQAIGNNIVLNYSISRSQVGDKIAESKALCSYVPTVSNAVYWKSVTNNLSGISDDVVLNTAYSDTIKGLPSGKYYVRAAARTKNANSRFNYSPVFEVQVQ